jgi:O-antigen/teichoic acid export membrane protein
MMNSDTTPTAIPEPAAPEAGGAARRVALNALSPFATQVFTKLLMLGYGILQFRLVDGLLLGGYILATIIFSYTGTISEWGLGTLLSRDVARDLGTEKRQDVPRIFGQALAVRLGISLLLFVPVALYVALQGMDAQTAWAVALLTFSLLPSSFSGSVTAVLYGHERMSLPAVVSVITTVVNVALGIGALLLGMGIIGLAGAALATTFMTALIFLAIARREYPELLSPGMFHIDTHQIRSLLAAGWPLMLNALLVGLFFRADQFIIEASSSQLEVARYEAAYRFLNNFVLLITPAITLALFPRMARHAMADRPRLAYEYTFALKSLLLLSVPIIALTIWFAPLLITVVTGGKTGYLPYSAVALQILIFFLPFSFINGVTQYVLIALDMQRLITVAFGLTVAFNIAANLLLVPWLGINGAAIATVLSEIVLLGPFVWWVRRELGALPLLSLAWRPVAAGALVGLLAWLLLPFAESWQGSLPNFLVYLLLGALIAAVYTAAIFVLRPFTGAEMGTLRSALRRR